MRVYTLDPLRDRRWHEFVRDHPVACPFHAPAWVEALQRTYGYDPIVFTTTPPDERLSNGMLACRVRSWLTGRRVVSVPFADHCEPLVDVQEDREAIIQAFGAAAADDGPLELRPQAAAPWGRLGMRPVASFRWHTIDLRPSLDEIFQRFHRDGIQRKIARATREGVICEQGTSGTSLQAFYRLMVSTRRGTGLPLNRSSGSPISFAVSSAAFRSGWRCAMDVRLPVCSRSGTAERWYTSTAVRTRAGTNWVQFRFSSGRPFRTPGLVASKRSIWAVPISMPQGSSRSRSASAGSRRT
jgi:hypothetical protein